MNGPSPRVWGKRPPQPHRPGPRRSIPTRVGKTDMTTAAILFISVHPHACGENGIGEQIAQQLAGPSPRVWGKRPYGEVIGYLLRSIPTRVGKTIASRCGLTPQSVHPHACGENVLVAVGLANADGPSPRVWGKPQQISEAYSCTRSIPTRVGKTLVMFLCSRGASVHPHACGENAPDIENHPRGIGPSPRVWGKRLTVDGCAGQRRSIPTRVGKTRCKRQARRLQTVHPHACGENSIFC